MCTLNRLYTTDHAASRLRSALHLTLRYSIETRLAIIIWLNWAGNVRIALSVAICLIGVAGLNYAYTVLQYRRVHRRKGTDDLPPRNPTLLPFIGNLVSYMADSRTFFRRVTSFEGRLTSTRISVLWYSIYAFQDRDSIKRIMSHPDLSSPMPVYLYCLKYLFGMPYHGIQVYRADNSGPLSKPYQGSSVQPEDRIDFGLHQGYLRALSGPGLIPTAQRIFQGIFRRVKVMESQLDQSDWADLPDLYQYFQKDFSSAIIEALFGTLLLRDPLVDQAGSVRARDNVRDQLKDWYVHARREFDEYKILPDGDGDLCWGSALMRERHKLLQRSHDDDSLASSDLGSIWAVIANTVPSILYAVLHIFKDPELLERVRAEVSERFKGETPSPKHVVELKCLTNMPLLESVYAETLRLYVKVWFMVSPAHGDVSLGRWRLPRGSIGVINSDISHMDNDFWNTRDGRHPVHEFWAERFLVDPADPSSGPVNPAIRGEVAPVEPKVKEGKPYFGRAGLTGSWIPYGGGPSICPGRHLAKHVILYVCSLLVAKFDIELHYPNDLIQLDSWRFGLGVGRPLRAVPVRIRTRKL